MGSQAFHEVDERVGLVDGAVWIREQAELRLAAWDALGLDFYHLSENVPARSDCSPERGLTSV